MRLQSDDKSKMQHWLASYEEMGIVIGESRVFENQEDIQSEELARFSAVAISIIPN